MLLPSLVSCGMAVERSGDLGNRFWRALLWGCDGAGAKGNYTSDSSCCEECGGLKEPGLGGSALYRALGSVGGGKDARHEGRGGEGRGGEGSGAGDEALAYRVVWP